MDCDKRLTLPAKNAAPPWETWRIMGAFLSLAASRAATAVEEEVTFYKSNQSSSKA